MTGPIYVDPLLTDVSVAYKNDSYIADMVFPVLEVNKRTGKFGVYDKSNLRKVQAERSGRGTTNEVNYEVTLTPYGPLKEQTLKAFITRDEIEQSDSPIDPRTDAAEMVSESLLVGKETALAAILSDSTQITQNATPTILWGAANSTPFEDIKAGFDTIKKNGLKRPNTIVMSYQVWTALRNNAELIDRVKYSQLGVLTEELMAELFGVSKVLIGDAAYNAAAEGQTDDLEYIWGKHLWLMYVTPQPGLKTISAGYTLTLKNGRYAENWEETDPKGEYVRVTDYYQHEIVAKEAIYGIFNAVA